MGSGSEYKNNPNILPKGKYTLIGVDIDTTGRRLIDEIVQLSAYTPKSQFAQYIMPYMNLNPAARQRHQIRVITIGFYRMLKCMQTYKVVKSKSEVAALKDFLDWIESVNNSDPESIGVILIYHEERKFTPYMMLEAFKKYGLLDRFLKTIKSFANGYDLAKSNCCNANANISNQFSLRKLSKVILNNSEINLVDHKTKNDQSPNAKNSLSRPNEFFEGSASVRAKLAYEIAQYLALQSVKSQEDHDTGVSSSTCEIFDKNDIDKIMFNFVFELAPSAYKELDELEIQNKNLERQNSFRPLFLQYFKTTLYHRVRAVKFRIILAENGLDFETLKAIWTEKRKEGLTEVIQAINDLKSYEKFELIDLLDSHYDPSKQPIKPVMKKTRRRSKRYQNRENKEVGDLSSRTKNKGAGDEKSQLADSTSNPVKKTSSNRSRNNSSSKNIKKGSKTAITSNL